MTKKTYRTAQGKIVDLGALMLKNENVRAVGNMGVNARGDLLDSANRPVTTRNQQVTKQYSRQTTGNVSDEPVAASRRPKERAIADPVVEETPPVSATEDPVVRDAEPVVAESGGLAAAIAKARAIKQEPLKTPRQMAQSKPGVNKI